MNAPTSYWAHALPEPLASAMDSMGPYLYRHTVRAYAALILGELLPDILSEHPQHAGDTPQLLRAWSPDPRTVTISHEGHTSRALLQAGHAFDDAGHREIAFVLGAAMSLLINLRAVNTHVEQVPSGAPTSWLPRLLAVIDAQRRDEAIARLATVLAANIDPRAILSLPLATHHVSDRASTVGGLLTLTLRNAWTHGKETGEIPPWCRALLAALLHGGLIAGQHTADDMITEVDPALADVLINATIDSIHDSPTG